MMRHILLLIKLAFMINICKWYDVCILVPLLAYKMIDPLKRTNELIK
jgi:hypothetical protein